MTRTEGARIVLGDSHARHITVTLRLLEERLAEIERLMVVNERGVLYTRVARFSPRQREKMTTLIAELRAAIQSVAEEFNLPREQQDPARRIRALLDITWESLGDMEFKRLGAYGDVDPELRERLDPWTERLTRLVLDLERTALHDE
jgi:hypothetical protein